MARKVTKKFREGVISIAYDALFDLNDARKDLIEKKEGLEKEEKESSNKVNTMQEEIWSRQKLVTEFSEVKDNVKISRFFYGVMAIICIGMMGFVLDAAAAGILPKIIVSAILAGASAFLHRITTHEKRLFIKNNKERIPEHKMWLAENQEEYEKEIVKEYEHQADLSNAMNDCRKEITKIDKQRKVCTGILEEFGEKIDAFSNGLMASSDKGAMVKK